MHLHLGQIAARYRLSGVAEPQALRRELDRAAAQIMPGALDALLPGVLAACRLSARAEVVVGELSVRVRVAGAADDFPRIAGAWAQAIAEALIARIRSQGGYGASDEIAVFEDRLAAEVAYLTARGAATKREAGWWRALFGGELPSGAALVAEWIRREPHRVARGLAQLIDAAPRDLGVIFPGGDAAEIVRSLRASRDVRLSELGVGLTPEPAGQTTMALDPLTRHLAARARDDAGIRLALEAASLAPLRRLVIMVLILNAAPMFGVPPDSALDAIAQSLRPINPRLGASPQAAPRPGESTQPPEATRPGPTPAEATETGSDSNDASPALGHRPGDPTEVGAAPATHAKPASAPRLPLRSTLAARGLQPAAPTGEPDADGTRATADRSRSPERIETRAGGLAFFCRRLMRLWGHHRGEELEGRLLGFYQLALGRTLRYLPPGLRRDTECRESTLIEILTGHDPDLAPSLRFDAEIDGVLAELTADLPEVDPQRSGVDGVYRNLPAAWRSDPECARLTPFALRPATLEVTASEAHLNFASRHLDLAIRLGGWDIDPGWVPPLGRIIRFHYVED